MKTEPYNNNFRIRIITLGLFILASVELTVYMFVSSNITPIPPANNIAMETQTKSTDITQLFFENQSTLPKDAITNKDYTFQFTVQNNENKDFSYSYQVYVDIEGYKLPVDSGDLLLASNETRTLTETYTIPLPIRKGNVVVNLINKNQKIDFPIVNQIAE